LKNLGISYLVCGEDSIDFSLLFSEIHSYFHVETLLLEGGGLLNGAVMEAGFVDEISLLLTPTVLNKSSAPSLFERKAADQIDTKKYTIHSVQTLEKNCVWIRYQRI
jgi:riboflavin biosynthesis pyrimidine reductase